MTLENTSSASSSRKKANTVKFDNSITDIYCNRENVFFTSPKKEPGEWRDAGRIVCIPEKEKLANRK